jgi:hypothetical protein
MAAADGELAIEGLSREQLIDKRTARAAEIQTLMPEGDVQKMHCRNVIQLLNALAVPEDVLLGLKATTATAETRDHLAAAVVQQRRLVVELTNLLKKLHIEVRCGPEMVDKVFPIKAGLVDFTDEEQKRWQEASREKEQELKQQQQRAKQLAASYNKWQQWESYGSY